MRKFALALLMICTTLSAEIYLGTELLRADPGDYMVTFQNRACTVLLIRDNNPKQLLLEEVTVPTQGSRHAHVDWRSWIEQGAPGHSNWVVYAIDKQSGEMAASYSYSRGGWQDTSQSGQFFTTLLGLPFHPIPQERRKRLGGNPGVRMSHRPVWHPPLMYEGARQPDVAFDAYEALWPLDGTELGGRRVTIYTPNEQGAYPDYFPYWIEVNPGVIENRIRVIDSGHGMRSPQTSPHELG